MHAFENHIQWKTVKDVCRRLTQAGHQTLLAGGCVRDLLMRDVLNQPERVPHDFDIATSATPDQVEKLFENAIGVGHSSESFRSAIVVTKNYVPHPQPVSSWPFSHELRVASYARGLDYHHFLKAELQSVAERLKQVFVDEEFLCFTDSAPVLERDLAARAGLGWVGKNTCLLDRKEGSLFLIGEIYTTLEFPVAKLEIKDFCGTCTRCIDACPTDAITAPREIDARRCISYLTIEARGLPDENLRTQIGDWFFGCDICQTVCPWNIKVHGPQALSNLNPQGEKENLIKDLLWILQSSNRTLEKALAGTPLLRAGGTNLKRNALIVIANKAILELKNEVVTFISHPKLSELATWTLNQLDESNQG